MLQHFRPLLFLCILFLLLKIGIGYSIDESFLSDIQVQNTSTLYLVASDINEDIKSARFHQAEERLRQFGIQTSITGNIVRIIHKINDTNLLLLMDHCSLSSKILIQYSVYESFWETINTNDKTDLYRLISLYEVFTNEIIDQEETLVEIRIKAKELRDNGIRDAIIRRSAEKINDAVFGGYYQNSTNIQSIAKALESLDEQISDDTIRKVTKDLYHSMPITDLIRNVYNTESVSQSVTALVSIHESLSVGDSLYGVIGLIFADRLSRLQKMPDYAKLSEEKKNEAARVVNNISNSIRSLYFSRKICIRNAHYLESIYSPINDYKWNTTRRLVFTWVPQGFDAQSRWFPKPFVLGEFLFQFESDFNKNEYLYIPNVQPYSDQYRRVMTWISGDVENKSTLWKIQAIKKDLVLINLLYNEYLCLSDEKFSANRRYVFTKRDVVQNSNPPKECIWMVDTC